MEQDPRSRAQGKRTPQLVYRWEKTGAICHFYAPQTTLEVSVVTDHILRFRYSPYGSLMQNFSYAIREDLPTPPTSIKVEEHDDSFFLETNSLRCVISKTLHISIYNLDGQLVVEDERGFHWEESHQHGGNFVYCSKRIQEQEVFFGLGDKTGNFNLRGRRFELWATDRYGYDKNSDPLYKNIPFYQGLHHGLGYGIFFDNTFRSHFDFGHSNGNVSSFWADGGQMDYYFIYGPELLRVVEGYAVLTGTHELPPLWALGFHQSKWSYFPESQVKSIAQKLRELQLPCDAIHLDIDYMDEFRCFTWNADRFPDPARMIQELKADGFNAVAITDPGIKLDPSYSVYREGIENGYFCRRADGPLMRGEVWPGICHFPDFTDPAVRQWWGTKFEDQVAQGIAGYWNDMNEPAVFELGTFPEDTRHDYDGHPCSHRKAHNIYGTQMARATYEGVKAQIFPRRFLNLTRSGFAGMQRFAATWTGDNISTWEHLWLANLQCQRMSISGVSFVGSDIGGFIGNPSPELFVRWMQLGAFHPFFRVHSSGDHGDQEPWSFGSANLPAIRKAIETRYRLLPYVYTTFRQHAHQGTPVIRPLVYLDQHDPQTHYRMDEFGLGPDLLICPILEEKSEGRQMYLPKGQWFNYWTDEEVTGGKEVWTEARLDTIPVYVRAGALLPHYPVMQHVGEEKLAELILHVYYTSQTYASQVYEDAGDFYEYEQGNYCIRTFSQVAEKGQTVIRQYTQGRFNSSYATFNMVLHGFPTVPKKVTIRLTTGEEQKIEVHTDGDTPEIVVSKQFEKLVIK
ncbi:MAG: glycoside hydrolase family 31 protein [Bacteroidota bacterium]